MPSQEVEAPLKYDDASWHYGGKFPDELPESAGATHIGMFVAWAALNGLAGNLHLQEFADDLRKLQSRDITPTSWFLSVCDEKFTNEDLSEEGNQFARAYYSGTEGLHTAKDSYLHDFSKAFPKAETLYHVPDTWTTFEILEPTIRFRYEAWRNVR